MVVHRRTDFRWVVFRELAHETEDFGPIGEFEFATKFTNLLTFSRCLKAALWDLPPQRLTPDSWVDSVRKFSPGTISARVVRLRSSTTLNQCVHPVQIWTLHKFNSTRITAQKFLLIILPELALKLKFSRSNTLWSNVMIITLIWLVILSRHLSDNMQFHVQTHPTTIVRTL